MEENLKVLVIDNETLVHVGLQAIMTGYWKNTEFLSEADSDNGGVPDLIILGEISARKPEGLRLLKKLRRKFKTSRILIFTNLAECHYGIAYLKGGAAGYLAKNADRQKIVTAIETVLKGEYLFSSYELKERLFDDFFSLTYRPKKKVIPF